MIVELGDWVLQEACRSLASWQQELAIAGTNALKISVNVASQQFQQPDFLTKLERILQQTKLDPSCLKLEITERVLVDSSTNTLSILTAIRDRQIELSIDDFGTGYSSLGYLRHLPIDNLKIDRSFIQHLEDDP